MSGFELIPLAFVAFGVLFAVIGIRNQRAGTRFTRSADQASAEVTDLRSRAVGHGTDSNIAYFPVVRFQLPDGRTVETETSTGNNWSRPKPGTPVDVLYDPENPTDVRIAGQVGGTLLNGFMIVFGVVFALVGVGFFAVLQAFSDALP
jgi:hypothetical protein